MLLCPLSLSMTAKRKRMLLAVRRRSPWRCRSIDDRRIDERDVAIRVELERREALVDRAAAGGSAVEVVDAEGRRIVGAAGQQRGAVRRTGAGGDAAFRTRTPSAELSGPGSFRPCRDR